MTAAQTAGWHALMAIHTHIADDWTLVGGQMVHLHCAERDRAPARPTEDADTVLDVRAEQTMPRRFTATLTSLGFTATEPTAEGHQHRWIHNGAVIDILIPDGLPERAAARTGVTGSTTLATPGGSQALRRSRDVAVLVDGSAGHVRSPNLGGALLMKAAAHTVPTDSGRARHRLDFILLADMMGRGDFLEAAYTAKEIGHLQVMIAAVRADHEVMEVRPAAATVLQRLERGLNR